MKRKHISDSLEHLDSAYVDEAADFHAPAIRLYKRPYFRFVAAAACLIVCASAVLITNPFEEQLPPVNAPTTTTMTTTIASSEERVTTTMATTTMTTTADTTASTAKTYQTIGKDTKTTAVTTQTTVTTTTRKTIYKGTTKKKGSTTVSKDSTTVATEINGTTTTTQRKVVVGQTTVRKTTKPMISGEVTESDPSASMSTITSMSTTTSTRKPIRPGSSFADLTCRTDMWLQTDKQEYEDGEVITVTIHNTTEETLEIYPYFFMAKQNEEGEWTRGWHTTSWKLTANVLAPGETSTATFTANLYLKTAANCALVGSVNGEWIKSDMFRMIPAGETTATENTTIVKTN